MENIRHDKKVLAELINKHFPDWRRVLNECQRYSISGEIDSGILATIDEVNVNDLLKSLKEKTFPKFVNGLSITWTMILLYYCVMFTMLFLMPLKGLALLLLSSSLLVTSIKLPLLQIKKSISLLLSRR